MKTQMYGFAGRCLVLACLFIVINEIAAGSADFITYTRSPLSGRTAGTPVEQSGTIKGRYEISLEPSVFSVYPGQEFSLKIKGLPSYIILHDRKVTHKSGAISWFGYLKGPGKGYRVSLMKDHSTIQGQITTPQGVFLIDTRDGATFLTDLFEQQVMMNPPGSCRVKIPSPKGGETGQAGGDRGDDNTIISSELQQDKTETSATIDLIILYNQDFANQYRGSLLESRLNHLVELSNQAYIDSGVYITIRMVHHRQIDNVSNTLENEKVLDDMSDGLGVFSVVPNLRAYYGADLVMFIRPFDYQNHRNCGISWLNGYNGTDISLYAHRGFSVVSEGPDSGYYCEDYTFTHELGHNMGNAHDRDHAGISGAYSYSYGYDTQGTNAFGTIMSYDGPRLGYFSNPDISECNSQPCGLPVTHPESAFNALSMNNTRHKVAAFSPMVQPVTIQQVRIPYSTNSAPFWTGLSIHNESSVTQTYMVFFYADNGGLIGTSTCLSAPPNGMVTDLIQNLVTGTISGRVSMVIRTPDMDSTPFSATVYIGNTGASNTGYSFMTYRSEDVQTTALLGCTTP
ncbi:MAG: hypothetical protein D3926_11180 [Desulfobacteraceae bacterium]|nr:MAG: hypothetical protein D3926_11180 [Desulfobacteraceae bacterium]